MLTHCIAVHEKNTIWLSRVIFNAHEECLMPIEIMIILKGEVQILNIELNLKWKQNMLEWTLQIHLLL